MQHWPHPSVFVELFVEFTAGPPWAGSFFACPRTILAGTALGIQIDSNRVSDKLARNKNHSWMRR